MDQIYVSGERNILRHCAGGPHMTIQYVRLQGEKRKYHNTERVRTMQILYKPSPCQAHLPGSTSTSAHLSCPGLC